MTTSSFALSDRRSRSCPVCYTSNKEATLFLRENIDPARLSEFSFASRKIPERMCHRLVRCPKCDLVYVDEPPGAAVLSRAYHEASYDSAQEADDAAAVYIHALGQVLPHVRKGAALEIGTGSGAFLEALHEAGFNNVVGVEPSTAAIASAPEHRRAWITEGTFDESAYAADSFDLVACFMTLEHVLDPRHIAESAHRLLRPGGAFVTITHDYRSFVNRMLGKRSPIIDVEHMQLFSPKSIRSLFEAAGYQKVTINTFVNRYRVGYWLRLFPLPDALRTAITATFAATRADRIMIGANVGNTLSVGFK